jgi:hypothetical protein
MASSLYQLGYTGSKKTNFNTFNKMQLYVLTVGHVNAALKRQHRMLFKQFQAHRSYFVKRRQLAVYYCFVKRGDMVLFMPFGVTVCKMVE